MRRMVQVADLSVGMIVTLPTGEYMVNSIESCGLGLYQIGYQSTERIEFWQATMLGYDKFGDVMK
jgi:hypothetical protein